MRVLALAALTVACHKGHTCSDELDALARFFSTIAAEQQASPLSDGVIQAEMSAGIRDHVLVAVLGKPADVTKSDYLAVSADRAALATADGKVRDVMVDDAGSFGGDQSRTLAVAIAPATPWRTVLALRHALSLGDPELRYGAVVLVYQIDGAFAGRSPPAIEGATSDGVDLVRVGEVIAKEAADHCPAVAVDLAKLRERGTLLELLPALATDVPKCTCATDLHKLEAIAWLVRRRISTTVPLLAAGSPAPPLPQLRDGATFADAVRANGGKPLVLALEPLPPPPPPPPRHAR